MVYFCSVCRHTISERVYEYSMKHFGRTLCFSHQRAKPQDKLCSFCKQKISDNVYDYSMRHFGKALCMEHQKNSVPEVSIPKTQTRRDGGYYCLICKRRIRPNIYRYSVYNYDRPLCKSCQPWKDRKRRSAPRIRSELDKTSRIEVGGKIPEDKKYYNGY